MPTDRLTAEGKVEKRHEVKNNAAFPVASDKNRVNENRSKRLYINGLEQNHKNVLTSSDRPLSRMIPYSVVLQSQGNVGVSA